MAYLTWKSFDWKYGSLPIFEAMHKKRNAFFLDSSLQGNGLGRYSFLGAEPFYIFTAQSKENPFGKIKELLSRYTFPKIKGGFPFFAGAVGYFSYDLGLYLEKIEGKALDDLKLPQVFLSFYDTVIAIDHWKKKLIVASGGFPETSYSLAKRRAEGRLKQCIKDLAAVRAHKVEKGSSRKISSFSPRLQANFTKERYLEAVIQAKEYIRKGDIYQVNLSQRFSAQCNSEASDLYARLRQISPANFSAYLECGGFQIISSSPERFLSFNGEKVITRPMKGTRPRGKSPGEDMRQRQGLLKSRKDKAELTMIVDLMRNDLGRVCEYGSVKVKSLCTLEAYATVYQTTATVEGILHKDKSRIELLKACFPGGSITGCPKIRSMQIIEELEPTRRGIYTGSLGYLSFHNTMDLNILIRTILKKNDTIYFQVGGGIVADSKPEAEYEETLVKARGMMQAIGTVLSPAGTVLSMELPPLKNRP